MKVMLSLQSRFELSGHYFFKERFVALFLNIVRQQFIKLLQLLIQFLIFKT
jgi:hypothetical protein